MYLIQEKSSSLDSVAIVSVPKFLIYHFEHFELINELGESTRM
jgi:hypothetical protein